MKPTLSLSEVIAPIVVAVALVASPDAASQRVSKPQPTIAVPALTVEDFVLAVANDRVDEVKRDARAGMDPNTVGPNGDPVLVTAARAGSAKSSMCCSRPAQRRRANAFGDTALMMAALHGQLDIVKKLRARRRRVDPPGLDAADLRGDRRPRRDRPLPAGRRCEDRRGVAERDDRADDGGARGEVLDRRRC